MAYDRGLQHLRAMEKRADSHPMVEHWKEEHPMLKEVRGEMKVRKVEERPLYRQVGEGIYIQNFRGDKILNSRGDWGQNLPPTLET